MLNPTMAVNVTSGLEKASIELKKPGREIESATQCWDFRTEELNGKRSEGSKKVQIGTKKSPGLASRKATGA